MTHEIFCKNCCPRTAVIFPQKLLYFLQELLYVLQEPLYFLQGLLELCFLWGGGSRSHGRGVLLVLCNGNEKLFIDPSRKPYPLLEPYP